MISIRDTAFIQKIEYKKRHIDAGRRPFKRDLRDRFVMLLVYYRLYITYTLLAGFLFDLDQSNICRGIQKIERQIRGSVYQFHRKFIQQNKKVKNT
jgi:hypothetical protein